MVRIWDDQAQAIIEVTAEEYELRCLRAWKQQKLALAEIARDRGEMVPPGAIIWFEAGPLTEEMYHRGLEVARKHGLVREARP
jgi:hypothetical protein